MSKRFLVITILTFATIVAWVIFGIIHQRSQVEIPAKLQEITQPLNPQFNTKGVESLP